MKTRVLNSVPVILAMLWLTGISTPASAAWPAINCAQSPLQTTPMQVCRRGPPVVETPSPGNSCTLNDYTTSYEQPDKFTYVRVRLVAGGANISCYMAPDSQFATDIRRELPRLSTASNWSSPVPFGMAGEELSFQLPERNCIAFFNHEGPVWTRIPILHPWLLLWNHPSRAGLPGRDSKLCCFHPRELIVRTRLRSDRPLASPQQTTAYSGNRLNGSKCGTPNAAKWRTFLVSNVSVFSVAIAATAMSGKPGWRPAAIASSEI